MPKKGWCGPREKRRCGEKASLDKGKLWSLLEYEILYGGGGGGIGR